MSHRAKIVWVPFMQRYQITCLDCGELLCDDIATLPPFQAPGDCEPDENTLGISVEEKIKTTDIFGKR